MKAIKITSEMVNDGVDALKELCLFMEMASNQVRHEVYIFSQGEGFNYKGFSTDAGCETMQVLREGDYLIKVGKEFKKVTSDLAFLVEDSLAADRMETFLDEIYQSGTLNGEMDARYREFFNLNVDW